MLVLQYRPWTFTGVKGSSTASRTSGVYKGKSALHMFGHGGQGITVMSFSFLVWERGTVKRYLCDRRSQSADNDDIIQGGCTPLICSRVTSCTGVSLSRAQSVQSASWASAFIRIRATCKPLQDTSMIIYPKNSNCALLTQLKNRKCFKLGDQDIRPENCILPSRRSTAEFCIVGNLETLNTQGHHQMIGHTSMCVLLRAAVALST